MDDAGPPKLILATDAVRYVELKFGIKVSRQTIHNWHKTGVNHRKLKAFKRGGRYFTTYRWLDEFLAE